ncbi:hypothetical protein ARUE_232p00290 (plasmid) [Arthrobacter sp. Rue61a]|nr:hypothetical protein ARUE_232p00290 [Arthrobacter sp. Rue61a]
MCVPRPNLIPCTSVAPTTFPCRSSRSTPRSWPPGWAAAWSWSATPAHGPSGHASASAQPASTPRTFSLAGFPASRLPAGTLSGARTGGISSARSASPQAPSWCWGWPEANVSPKIRMLAGAIGTGLTFSAATNTCAMGQAISAMPWNKTAKEPTRETAILQLSAATARQTPAA